jgi:hypothetical protein
MKNGLGLLSAFLFFAVFSSAQENTEKNDSKEGSVFNYVPQMPSTGFDLKKYLSDNCIYPKIAKKHHVQGRIIVMFIVNEDGSISDCHVARNSGSAPSFPGKDQQVSDGFPSNVAPDTSSIEEKALEAEAIRVVENMPKMETGVSKR